MCVYHKHKYTKHCTLIPESTHQLYVTFPLSLSRSFNMYVSVPFWMLAKHCLWYLAQLGPVQWWWGFTKGQLSRMYILLVNYCWLMCTIHYMPYIVYGIYGIYTYIQRERSAIKLAPTQTSLPLIEYANHTIGSIYLWIRLRGSH